MMIKICTHKKALLGLLDKTMKKEQWYCNICQKVYLKKKGESKMTIKYLGIIVQGIGILVTAISLICLVRLQPLPVTATVIGILVYLAGNILTWRIEG